jgi:hypothetical protein
LETKNPAFEKTGILSTTIEINGTPTTFVYNRELGFLPMPELSTDLVHPTPLPIEYVHSLAALQFILLRYGDGEPFPTDNFPGWAIQFQYRDKDGYGKPIPGVKVAYLWPRNGKTEIYNPVFQKDGKVLWFMLINPQDGTGYLSTVFRVFNPKNPQNPQNGDDQLLIFGTIGSADINLREEEKKSYNNIEDQMKRGNDRPLVLAQEGGYYRAIRNEPSLDSLLGMEGNDGRDDPFIKPYIDHLQELGLVDPNTGKMVTGPLEYIKAYLDENGNIIYEPLWTNLQQLVLVISP